jgi:hypothetical protein
MSLTNPVSACNLLISVGPAKCRKLFRDGMRRNEKAAFIKFPAAAAAATRRTVERVEDVSF